ncbi:MAG: hypothetical protein IJJ19_05490 [Erysipelotrichaceae bacterium]|nr:hypothetical protein [Erysipelotrichaceae bacterium]
MNNKVYQHYQGYEFLIRKLEESINRYEKNYIPVVYGFLGVDELKIAQTFIGNSVPYQLFGGYEGAFSKRLVIGEDLNAEDYICCLKATYDTRFNTLTHRDVLGAVYHLGIDQETYGDMWVNDGEIYIYVTEEISSFVIDSLDRIGRVSVRFTKLDYFPEQVFKFKTRSVTVSSYRLDKILSAVIRKSREKAREYVKNGLVNVNYKTIEDCDFICHNTDILSIRGVGRFQIGEEIASTKSGNYVIEIRQYV